MHLHYLYTIFFTLISTQGLTRLNLMNNNITTDQAIYFASALKENKVIISLYSLSSFTHIQYYYLTQTLIELFLEDNQILDDGVKHFVDALQQNTVKFLYLNYHFVHNFFLEQTLTTLDLAKNGLTNSAVEYLSDILKQNRVDYLFNSVLLY